MLPGRCGACLEIATVAAESLLEREQAGRLFMIGFARFGPTANDVRCPRHSQTMGIGIYGPWAVVGVPFLLFRHLRFWPPGARMLIRPIFF